MKKIFALAVAALAVSFVANAQTVGYEFDDGIFNYTVISADPAQVEIARSPYAAGQLEIPAEVTDYDITYKVVKIGAEAFSLRKDENPNITGTLTIPEGITEIGWQAFIGCNRIDSISLPSTLEKIGNAAFYCYNDKPSKLHAVRCMAVMPPACGEMVFGSRFNAQDGVNRDIPLWVPVGSVMNYRAQKQWDYFNIIIDVEGQESSTVDEQHYDPDPDADDQAVDNVFVGEKAHKVFIDGQLRIVRGDKVFDITGKQL